MEIYTIGHSNYTMERLIDMLEYYNINCVVDIREHHIQNIIFSLIRKQLDIH